MISFLFYHIYKYNSWKLLCSIVSKRNQLTEEQRFYIKFLYKENKSLNEIRKHPLLLKPDGTIHRSDTLTYWINPIDDTGDVKQLKKTGRPKILNNEEEKLVINMIKNRPKERYSKIRRLINKNIIINRRTLFMDLFYAY